MVMITLPKQLQNPDFRFIKLGKNSKKALEKDWKDTNNYSWKEIQAHKGNIGLVNKYGSLLVIDADSKEISDCVKKELPKTFTIQSSRGYKNHFIYHCANTIIDKITFRNGLGDIRGYNGNYYTVIPPSIHPGTKKPYKVANPSTINEISEKQVLEVLGKYKEKNNSTSSGVVWNEKPCKHDITKVIDMSKLKLLNSGEYQGVNPFIGSKTGHNFSVNVEKNLFKDWHNNIGGKTTDIIAIKEGIISYDRFVELKRRSGGLSGPDYVKSCEIGRAKYKLPIPERKLSLMVKNTETGKRELNIEDIVDRLAEEYHFITVEDNTGLHPHLYMYKNGYYVIKGLQELEKIIKKMFRESPYQWKTWYRNEIREYIKTENVIFRDDIEPPSNLINLNNGVYDIESRKLLPHDPKYYFLYKIPINYNPERSFKGSEIEKYFTSTLKPSFVKTSQELFGYCMYSRYSFHGIFYLFGPGGNGKGVWEYLLTNMLGGANNVTSKELHKIANDRFTSGLLYGKLANVSSEMSAGILRNTTMLKAMSAGDSISGELKGMNGFDFKNKAKIIVSGNAINYSTDKSDGWYERQYVIPFCQHFRDIVEVEKLDLGFKLATDKKEMEILLLWAIEGLHRLLKNKKFTYPGDHKKAYRLYIRSEYKFVDMCCIYTNKWTKDNKPVFVTCEKVYDKFTEWCEKYNIPRPESNDALDRALTIRGFQPGQRRTINGKQVSVKDFMEFNSKSELNLLELEMTDTKG